MFEVVSNGVANQLLGGVAAGGFNAKDILPAALVDWGQGSTAQVASVASALPAANATRVHSDFIQAGHFLYWERRAQHLSALEGG